MISRRTISVGVMASGLGIAAAAMAQPADCSLGEIPDRPLVLRTTGSPDRLLPAVSLDISALRTTFPDSDTVYRHRDLVMEDGTRKDMFSAVVEADVSLVVPEGEPLDGKVFRLRPTRTGAAETDGQNDVGGVQPIQYWAVKIPNPPGSGLKYAIEATKAGYIASVRIEFAMHSGKTLPGRIHFCVPGNQVGMFDRVLKDPFEVVGSFTATLK